MKSKYFCNSNQTKVEIKFKKKSQWVPPRSPYSLIQESLYHDPWKLLLSTMFLQKSAGKSAVPVFWQFIQRWSNPQAVINEDVNEIEKLIHPLGLHRKRAVMFKRFSEEFITKHWKYPIELHGIGKYGNDSYRIFCVNEWKQVHPKDSKLVLYHNWLQENEHLLNLEDYLPLRFLFCAIRDIHVFESFLGDEAGKLVTEAISVGFGFEISNFPDFPYVIFTECLNPGQQNKKTSDAQAKRTSSAFHKLSKKESKKCVDMEELLQFEAARQRALNYQPSDAEVNLFSGFVQNRIFINQVDTFNGSHLVKCLNEMNKEQLKAEAEEQTFSDVRETDELLHEMDDLVESTTGKGSEVTSAYEIIGTLEFYNNQDYEKQNGITELLDNQKKTDFLKKILTCGYIIYDITSDLYCHPSQIQEAKLVIEVIFKRLSEMETYAAKTFAEYYDCRTFILISPLMTWAKTKPLDPENPTLPFTEKNYRKRKPHANYKAHCELEKRVIELGKKYPNNLRTIVIGSGVPYGHEEDVFHFLFKMAWKNAPHLPIFRPGKNSIPVIHIDSLTSIIYSVINSFPQKHKYIFAADPQSVVLKELVKLLAKHLGNGKTRKVNEAEAFLYPEVKQKEYDMLTLDLNVEAGYVMDNPMIKWGNDSPFTENISKLIEEFKVARGLLPIKIFIHGPPASGKTHLAKRLSVYYDICHLHVKGVIDEYIQTLKDKIEAINTKGEKKTEEENIEIEGDETVDNKEEDDDDDDEEEGEDLETLKRTLEEIETNMENNERNRLDESYVIRFFKEKLLSNSCMNKGYVIDGYPKTMEDTKALYEPTEDGEAATEYDTEEGQDDDLSRLCNLKILPAYVESLDASDEFLINRVIRLPARNMTQFEEHEMCRRLTEFRVLNTEENTPLIFYDELDVHPMIYNVENDTDSMMEPTFQAIIEHVGPPKNYEKKPDLSGEKQKAELFLENLKVQKEEVKRLTEERRETMQKWMFQKNQEMEMEEKALVVLGLPLRHYLMKYIFPCLTRGLVEVARVRPDDPVDFLAEFLFRENPEGKMFQPDYDEKEERLAQAIKEYESACLSASTGSKKSSRKSYSTERSVRSDAVSKVSGYKCSWASSTTTTKKSSTKSSKSTVSSGICTCAKSPSLSTCSSDLTPSTASSCKCGEPEPCETSEPCTPDDDEDPCKCPCT